MRKRKDKPLASLILWLLPRKPELRVSNSRSSGLPGSDNLPVPLGNSGLEAGSLLPCRKGFLLFQRKGLQQRGLLRIHTGFPFKPEVAGTIDNCCKRTHQQLPVQCS